MCRSHASALKVSAFPSNLMVPILFIVRMYFRKSGTSGWFSPGLRVTLLVKTLDKRSCTIDKVGSAGLFPSAGAGAAASVDLGLFLLDEDPSESA